MAADDATSEGGGAEVGASSGGATNDGSVLHLGTPDGAADSEASTSSTPCTHSPSEDGDHDGFTGAQGDCDDCDPNSNPGAYDVPSNGIDEDCNGKADDEPALCDSNLAVDSTSTADATKALGLCRRQSGKSWGVISATWVFPDGTSTALTSPLTGCPTSSPPNPDSHGLLTSFGTNVSPREGSTLLAISSGMARAGSTPVPSPGYGTSPDDGRMCTYSAAPTGFPSSSPSCTGVTAPSGDVYDGMALELKIKVPTNASALAFDFDFYSTEFPNYVCSSDGYNDEFAALLWTGATGIPSDHDVAFDSKGDHVSVNNSFMQVCVPQTWNGVTWPCPLGSSQLQGTGLPEVMGTSTTMTFTQGGATGWLTTHAGVVPGETITLRFAIWDAGDNTKDSTALVDHVTWTLSPGRAPAAAPMSGPPATMRPPQ